VGFLNDQKTSGFDLSRRDCVRKPANRTECRSWLGFPASPRRFGWRHERIRNRPSVALLLHRYSAPHATLSTRVCKRLAASPSAGPGRCTTHCAYANGTRPCRLAGDRESLPETGPRSPRSNNASCRQNSKTLPSQTTKLASSSRVLRMIRRNPITDYTAAQSDQSTNPSDPTKTIALKQRQTKQTAAAGQSQPGPVGLRRRQVPTGRYAEPARQFAKSERQLAREAGYGAAGAQRRANLRFPGTPENASGGASGVRCLCVRARQYRRTVRPGHGRPSSDPAKRVILYAFNDSQNHFLCAASPTICSP